MKPPKIIIPIGIVDTLGCVYKVKYFNKYVVVMAKSVYRSVDSINNDIVRYHNGVREGTGKNNLYQNFYQYIVDNPNGKLSIEMVLSTDNAYQLLKSCQIELDNGSIDDNCLNTFFAPYINKDIQKPLAKRKSIWWINRGAYLNFLRWQRNRDFKPI